MIENFIENFADNIYQKGYRGEQKLDTVTSLYPVKCWRKEVIKFCLWKGSNSTSGKHLVISPSLPHLVSKYKIAKPRKALSFSKNLFIASYPSELIPQHSLAKATETVLCVIGDIIEHDCNNIVIKVIKADASRNRNFFMKLFDGGCQIKISQTRMFVLPKPVFMR